VSAGAEPLARLIGLAMRGRAVTVGREACKRAARNGVLYALLMARDAGGSAARDCGATATTRVLGSGLDKRQLGELVGRSEVAALGITDPNLADGIARHAMPVQVQDPPRRG
jgi:hypothetical protein